MDVPTSLLCVVLVIGSAAVLFIISKLGMRSMSYEEVVAENRRLAAQRGLLDDVQRTKKAQQQQTKKNKKAGKKVKEKQAKEQQAATSNSEIDSDGPVDSGPEEETPSHSKHAHVEFVESVVVDSEAAPPKPAKGKKRGKEPKVKPILLNKDDPSCISDVSVPPSPTTTEPANHFEQIHPKDEFELLHSNDKESAPKEKKESKPGKHGKGKSGGKQNLEKPTEPEIVPAPEPEPVPQEPPKEQRKVKAKQPAPVAEKVSEKWTETAVTYSSAPSQPSNLTTDKLLKKAYPLEAAVPAPNSVTIPGSDAVVTNGPSAPPKGKKKKGDPMHQLTMGGDGLNVNMLVRVLSTTPLSRSEIQILTDCLLNKQNGPLPEHSEWSEGPKDPVQKLKRQLAEKEKALTDEQEASQAVHAKLKELRASLNAERSRCTQLTANADMAANNLRLEVSSLQTRIQRSTEETNVLRQQVLMLQNKLSAEAEFTAQRSQLELHIQALSENKVSLTADLGSLQAEIADLRAEYNKATNELHISHDQNLAAQRNATEIARQLEEAKRINADLEVQKLNIKQELLVANDRLKTFNETRAELQHLMSLNSRSQQLSMQHEKQQEELDRQNQQLQTELNRIKSERDVLTTVVMEMKEELASRPTPNGTTTPEKDDSEVVEKAVAAACRELEAKHSQQIALLQGQLDQHRDKNNDAVTAAEAAEQRASKEVLQRLFPSVNVKAPSHREWLQQFSAQAGTLLATPPPAAPTHDLEKQNAELQARIDTYQRIINDTEGILSRLQNNVSQEEQRWKKQLMEKQTELDNLKKNSLSKLEDKIESLQKTLENEHEIRVDLEKRLSEAERLKTGGACFAEIEGRLQDSTLSLNGPSQLPIPLEHKASKKRRTLAGWLRRKITFRRRKYKEKRADQERGGLEGAEGKGVRYGSNTL